MRRAGKWPAASFRFLTTMPFPPLVHNPRIIDTVTYLHREMDQPIRFGALYEVHRKPEDPTFVRKFYSYTGNLTGVGDDYLWVHGVASELWDSSFPQSCLGPDLPAPPQIKKRELCPRPGVMYWDVLETALKNGWGGGGGEWRGSGGGRRVLALRAEG